MLLVESNQLTQRLDLGGFQKLEIILKLLLKVLFYFPATLALYALR